MTTIELPPLPEPPPSWIDDDDGIATFALPQMHTYARTYATTAIEQDRATRDRVTQADLDQCHKAIEAIQRADVVLREQDLARRGGPGPLVDRLDEDDEFMASAAYMTCGWDMPRDPQPSRDWLLFRQGWLSAADVYASPQSSINPADRERAKELIKSFNRWKVSQLSVGEIDEAAALLRKAYL